MAAMGFPDPPPVKKPGFFELLQNGLLGPSQNYGGLLSPEDQQAARSQAMLALGSNLMAAGGPSPTRVSFGQALAPAIAAGQQTQRAATDDYLQAMLLKVKMNQAAKGSQQPSDVRSYEYAKANGYAGSFEDWKRVAAAQPQVANAIEVHKYFETLSPEQKKEFLATQRSPVLPQLSIVNGVPTLVDRTDASTTPLSTQESEIQAVTRKAQAEAEAKATGQATGEAKGGLQKKAINALNVLETLDLADPLIDSATGSATGAAADKVASFFGASLKGDQANAQLKVLQANLMTNMPRMEGPQSDRDVQLYREAAGEIGDPTVPRARKKAAVQMIRSLQTKYAEGMGIVSGQAPIGIGQSTEINGVKIKRVK